MTPLAKGFPKEQRIENAGSLRLTQAGVQFLQDNAATLAAQLMAGGGGEGGVMKFEIPSSGGKQLGIEYTLCPGGADPDNNKCVAEIDLGSAELKVEAVKPHNIKVTGPLPMRIQNLPIHIKYFCVLGQCLESDIGVTLNGNDKCPGQEQTFAAIDLDVDISIEIDNEPTHSRQGYSRVKVKVGINQDQLEAAVHFCGSFDAMILEALKSIIFPLVADQLIGQIQKSIDAQLCQQANPDLDPPCPEGTTNVDGVCRYGNDDKAECASILLGSEGHVDAGGLLAGVSPGTRAAFDLLFAAGGHSVRNDGSGYHWGDLNPVGGGATLGMYGGLQPMPASSCVPLSDLALPTAIPIPDELLANEVSGWPKDMAGPHFGFAVSERYANYALAQMHNSGMLCLGIGGDFIAQLTTTLLGAALGAPSLRELTWQQSNQQLAIAVRPQKPATVAFGNGTDIEADPLIRVRLEQLSLDFYVWSLDRFIRAMTATYDVEIPMNMVVAPEGLQPVIEKLTLTNGAVTNAALLREDPAAIALTLQELVSSMVGSMIGSAIPPIDINKQLASTGLELLIPPTVEGKGSPGLRKLSQDKDNYLGLFGTLALAAAPKEQSMTSAALDDFAIDPKGLRAATITPDNAPRARLRLGSSLAGAGRPVEWQYRVDRGPWHPFRRDPVITVSDTLLRLQGRHTVLVRSQLAGVPGSLDRDAAAVVLTVDTEPPQIAVRQDAAGLVRIELGDRVSAQSGLRARWRFGELQGAAVTWQPWSEWAAADALAPIDPAGATRVAIEARDEEGNVAEIVQALIRGRVSGDGSGCGCRVPGAAGAPRAGSLLALGMLGVVLGLRRRRGLPRVRAWLGPALLPLALGLLSGCSCGDETETAGPGLAAGCRGRGDCTVIRPGLIGAYSSAAAAPDGTLWVAGYLEANWNDDLSFGDLVVGAYDGTDVRWKAVDGVPEEPAVDPEHYDPLGFRGGQTEAGDDVGLWTSIAIDDAGSPGVAYYDVTGRALRYAHLENGKWVAAAVAQAKGADFGRYAKLLFVAGKPTIAYHFAEPAAPGTMATSGVRLATGSSPLAGEAQWNVEDVVADKQTPCRALLCPDGTKCVAASGVCAAQSGDCPEECGSGDECVELEGKPTCAATYGKGKLDSYPDAVGLYVSIAHHASVGVVVAWYDRVRGNVMLARKEQDGWHALVVDGQQGDADTGDMGIGASLAIDAAGHCQLAYVDGLSEGLRFAAVPACKDTPVAEVVDDGVTTGGLASDGQHLVGDDAHIVVTQGGEVHISYQDATAGKLRFAVGTPAAEGHNWTLKIVEQEGFAGAFSRQVEVGGGLRVVNWWRVATPYAMGNVRVVAP
ncbi:MAG: hypothetical protein HY744_19275 [Deltaproteobacteria bacterium]|nr:hypothetical protein [Deltaproteobacteria bacterium]